MIDKINQVLPEKAVLAEKTTPMIKKQAGKNKGKCSKSPFPKKSIRRCGKLIKNCG